MSTIRLKPLTPRRAVPAIVVNPGDSKVIGRATTADLQVDDISLSRRRVGVTMTAAGEPSAEDLGSTNGILVKGAPQRTARIDVARRLTIGAVEFFGVQTPVPLA